MSILDQPWADPYKLAEVRAAQQAVIVSARRYHEIATTRPVISAEWVEAWRALGADIEALDYVERALTTVSYPDPPDIRADPVAEGEPS